ncbi:MAG: sensor domain-containing diguanylate cyclase [Peptostreptococcaceae bacterium]|nr:sensor domain-containing diguanylate cyclase [Peptostreptococcaceae bacterium]
MEAIPDSKFGAILILDDEGILRMPTTKGYPDEMVKNFHLKPEDSLVYRDIGRIPKEICIVREIDKKLKVQSPELLVLEGERVKTSLVAPVWIDGKFYGFINIDSTKNNVFGKDDIEIMEYMRNQIQTVLSKQRKYQKELMSMRTDSLTGLLNRGYLGEMAKKAIEFAKSSGQSLCLVIMDIDRMKQINDSFGHIAGDFVLKSFSRNFSAGIRDCDILGRFGGDEFVAIFPGSGKEKINKKMEKIRNSMERVFVEYEKKNLQLRFSFGISEYPIDGDTFKKLIKTADGDMYEDKKSRKEK